MCAITCDVKRDEDEMYTLDETCVLEREIGELRKKCRGSLTSSRFIHHQSAMNY